MENKNILDSWKEIAAYLGRSVKTCQRLEKDLGLPVHRLEESPRARVFAYTDEIDQWIERTQNSDRKIFINNLRLKRIAIPVSILVSIVIVIMIWQFFPQKAPEIADKDEISIAVLPFDDLSPQKDHDYFCDGFAATIITTLMKLKDLRITAPNSSFLLRGKDRDFQEIGAKLNVKTVLRGSVQPAGTKVRITAQLIDVSDGNIIWSEQYNREMDDIFAIQDEITLALVDKLRIELLSGDRQKLTKRYSNNIEAYNLYLKGSYIGGRQTKEAYVAAIEYHEKALEIDPDFALAYLGLAGCYGGSSFWGYISPKNGFPKAKALIEKALTLDDTLPEIYVGLANISLFYDWDWEAFEKHAKRVKQLSPGNIAVHGMKYEYLKIMGRFDEAIKEMKIFLDLDPLDIGTHVNLSLALADAGRWDEALEQHQKTLEMAPNLWYAHWLMGVAYQDKKMYKEAIASFQKALEPSHRFPIVVSSLGVAYAISGEKEKAAELLAELEERSKLGYVPKTSILAIYAALGEIDEAIELAEEAYDERDQWLLYGFSRPSDLDDLYSDPRCIALRKRIGLG